MSEDREKCKRLTEQGYKLRKPKRSAPSGSSRTASGFQCLSLNFFFLNTRIIPGEEPSLLQADRLDEKTPLRLRIANLNEADNTKLKPRIATENRSCKSRLRCRKSRLRNAAANLHGKKENATAKKIKHL